VTLFIIKQSVLSLRHFIFSLYSFPCNLKIVFVTPQFQMFRQNPFTGSGFSAVFGTMQFPNDLHYDSDEFPIFFQWLVRANYLEYKLVLSGARRSPNLSNTHKHGMVYTNHRIFLHAFFYIYIHSDAYLPFSNCSGVFSFPRNLKIVFVTPQCQISCFGIKKTLGEIFRRIYTSRLYREYPIEGMSRLSKEIPAKHK